MPVVFTVKVCGVIHHPFLNKREKYSAALSAKRIQFVISKKKKWLQHRVPTIRILRVGRNHKTKSVALYETVYNRRMGSKSPTPLNPFIAIKMIALWGGSRIAPTQLAIAPCFITDQQIDASKYILWFCRRNEGKKWLSVYWGKQSNEKKSNDCHGNSRKFSLSPTTYLPPTPRPSFLQPVLCLSG